MNKILFLICLAVSLKNFCDVSSADIHNYFMANYKQFAGNIGEAQEWYRLLFQENPPIHAYKGYLYWLEQMGQYKAIAELAKQLEEKFTQDPDIQLLFAVAERQTGNAKAAADKLIKLNQQYKDHPEIAYQVVQWYVQERELENAIKIIDTFLNNSLKKNNNFIFYFLKGQIHAQLQHFQLASESLKKALELDPSFAMGWLLHALVQEQMGNMEQAMAGYTSYLNIIGVNAQIEKHLIELVLKQQRNLPEHAEILQLLQKKQYSKALELIQKKLTQNAQNKQVQLLHIELLLQSKNYQKALAALQRYLLENPDEELLALLNLFFHTPISGKKIIKVAKKIADTYPENDKIYACLASLYYKIERYKKATYYVQKSIALAKNDTTKAAYYYQLATLYEQRGLLPQCKEAITNAIHYHAKPEYIPLLVKYSTNSDYTLHLVEQLLKKYPLHKQLLQAQATIFFNTGKYQKAYELVSLIENDSAHQLIQDATIIYHFGMLDQACTKLEQAKERATNKKEITIINDLMQQWTQISA